MATPQLGPGYNGHPLDVNRGLICKKAIGKRVKLGNGDVVDVGRGSMAADGHVTQVPVLPIEVFMYVNEPGVYYDHKGRELPERVAAQAGYDVKREAAKRAVFLERKRISTEIEHVVAARSREVMDERGGFQLVQVDDLFTVVPTGGGEDYMVPNSEDVARMLFDELAAGDAPESVPAFPAGTFLKKGDDNANGTA